ncbi:MAG: hypothetical protein AAF609_07800 [Cyanobacteria bacterium P01_C01_bin.120]
MTATPEPRNFETEVLERLEQLDGNIKRLEQKLDADVQRLDARTDKWEERFLQLSKDNLAISRTVIIAAATVVIFGSLLDKAEILVEGATRLFGK